MSFYLSWLCSSSGISASAIILVVVLLFSVAVIVVTNAVLKPYSGQTHSFVKTKSTAKRAQRKSYAAPSSYFVNKDSLYIFYHEMKATAPSAVVVMVHGVGEHSGRYVKLAETLLPLSVNIVRFDLQGHGKSEGDRLFVVNFDDYVDDLDLLVQMMKEKYKGVPFFLLGHSMGGLVAIRYLEKHPKQFAGAILSAPALSVNVSSTQLSLLPFISERFPHLPVNKVNPNQLSHDASVVDWYCNDPMVFTGVTARLSNEILISLEKAIAFASEISLPYLLMRGEADEIVLKQGLADFHAITKSTDKTFVEFKGLYHEIFNEVNSDAAPATVEWLRKRIATSQV